MQHIVVTAAFYFNWAEIRATVAVNPDILLVLGAIVAVLFGVSLWGIIRCTLGVIDLVIALALFDMVGEFVAQGKIGITITLSFVVVVILLVLGLFYRRKER